MQCWLPAVSLFVCLLSQPWRQGHGGAVSPSARWRPPSPKSAVAARSSSSSFDSSHSLSAGPTYTITSPPTHLRFTEHAQPGQGDGTAWGTGEAQERGGMGEKRGGGGRGRELFYRFLFRIYLSCCFSSSGSSADGRHHWHQFPEWPDGNFWRESVLRGRHESRTP